MNENTEIKIRREFQKKYGQRIQQLEAIAQTYGYIPDIENEPLIEWILSVIHTEIYRDRQ